MSPLDYDWDTVLATWSLYDLTNFLQKVEYWRSQKLTEEVRRKR
jgi:hypothetical protein